MTPNLLNLPLGCAFATRARASAACIRTPLISEALPHRVRCFHPTIQIREVAT